MPTRGNLLSNQTATGAASWTGALSSLGVLGSVVYLMIGEVTEFRRDLKVTTEALHEVRWQLYRVETWQNLNDPNAARRAEKAVQEASKP